MQACSRQTGSSNRHERLREEQGCVQTCSRQTGSNNRHEHLREEQGCVQAVAVAVETGMST